MKGGGGSGSRARSYIEESLLEVKEGSPKNSPVKRDCLQSTHNQRPSNVEERKGPI